VIEMKRWLGEWKSLKSEYSLMMVLDALFGAWLLATLAFAPVFLALAELIVVFMQWKVWLFLIITLAAMGYFYLVAHWWFQSLGLKRPDHGCDLVFLRKVHGAFGAALGLAGGLLWTWVLMPIIWI